MLFLGLLFEKSEEHIIAAKSKGGFLQNQVNTFQWNCIDGLYENGVKNLTVINALPVGTYPRMYSEAIIPAKEWKYNGNTHFQIGSFNIPVLKQWGRYRACKKMLKQLNDKEIIVYSPYQPFLKAIKKLDKSYRVTLIVPDLPEYYDYARVGVVRKILRKINNRSIKGCMGRVDRFVLLTDAMKYPLEVGDRPYTVVEGICTSKAPKYQRKRVENKKAILYTGTLNKMFGIDVLLEAFEQIPNEDYELWICGGGDYQNEVQALAQKDKRISFFGFLPKEEVARLQSQATALVNPRQNIGEYTKYSFPSKLMEYLQSGVPVVAYKLDGIPDEYDAYFNYVNDNTPTALAQKLIEVCENESGYYEDVAQKARDFISEQKNSQKQMEKILELLKK